MSKTDRGVLDPSKLYYGDNGRVFCGRLHCAGTSAHFTRYTISGAPVIVVRAAAASTWRREFGEPMRCEGCGQLHPAEMAS